MMVDHFIHGPLSPILRHQMKICLKHNIINIAFISNFIILSFETMLYEA